MKSQINERFRRAYAVLPVRIRQQAREAYQLFRQNPRHPSLQFKKVHAQLPIYAARVNLEYRVLGVLQDDTIIWFWIGAHDEYERILRKK